MYMKQPLTPKCYKTACTSKPWKSLGQQLTSISLASLISLTAGWLGRDAIAPAVVQAYTSRVDVALDVQQGETYDVLVRRAEAIARAAAQRSFDRDILITDVSVFVVGQNQTATVPVVSLQVTRDQWRSRPDPRRWATYYQSSKGLLGLDGVLAPSNANLRPTVTTEYIPPKPPTTTAKPTTTKRTGKRSPTSRRPTSVKPKPSPVPKKPGVTATPSSSADAPDQPTGTPIIPERIPTPGGIGK
jgi:hypothetical protein